MEIELEEIRDFVAEHTPFNVLDDAVLNTVPQQMTIRYFRRNSPFPPTEKGGDARAVHGTPGADLAVR